MHEMSLVQSLFAQLNDLAAENQAKKITTVTMKIGPLAGVVVDSFQFGFDILSAERELTAGAKLIIKQSPVSYTCTGCGKVEVTAGPRPIECPACGDLLLIPEGGDDLLLLQVQME